MNSLWVRLFVPSLALNRTLRDDQSILNWTDVSSRLHVSRYTSKGATVYAIVTAKPPKPTVQLLGPKTSAATKVKGLRLDVFIQIIKPPVSSSVIINLLREYRSPFMKCKKLN